MTMKEFRELTKKVPDDYEICISSSLLRIFRLSLVDKPIAWVYISEERESVTLSSNTEIQ